ncbi:uncharacterized protein LOC144356254 [Saccoglossus kowalevskii]
MPTQPKKKKNKGPLPVSNISKILLHDNQLENLILEKSLMRINKDQRRSQRLLQMQKQTFIIKQACKEQELRDMGIPHVPFLPEIVMKQTEPDVKVRRPLAKPKKSASFLAQELEKISILPSINGTMSMNGGTMLEGTHRERFTHMHGIQWIPGSENEAEREREIMNQLNEFEAGKKCVDDQRFIELEKSLVRKERPLWEILGQSQPEAEDGEVEEMSPSNIKEEKQTISVA